MSSAFQPQMTRSAWKASPRDDEFTNDNDAAGISIDFVLYASIIIVILAMVIALIVKLLWSEDRAASAANETTGLLNALKVDEENYPFGSCSSSNNNSYYGTMTSSLRACSSSEDDLEASASAGSSCPSLDLYDPKICVICFDQLRNCLFTPCGHCVSCINCTDRIMSEETKSCPICRTSINQVSRLHIL